MQALIASGIEPVEPAPGEMEKLQRIMQRNNRAMAEDGLFSLELLQEVRQLIDTYRNGHAQHEGDSVASQ
jgi:hypothetical protein